MIDKYTLSRVMGRHDSLGERLALFLREVRQTHVDATLCLRTGGREIDLLLPSGAVLREFELEQAEE